MGDLQVAMLRSISQAKMSPMRSMCTRVFDRALKRKHKSRAAASARSAEFDYLRDEVADRLTDRLNDVTRAFPKALDLGANTGHVLRTLRDGRGGIKHLTMMDDSHTALHRHDDSQPAAEEITIERVVADDELLPFEDGTFDLVISNCSLHWANDVIGCLVQANNVLKSDGLLLCAIPGGATLQELRSSFAIAEQEREGGVAPHTSPTISVRDAGDLLVRGGFSLPTVDVEKIVVVYEDAYALMDHLRGMGASNALTGRRDSVPAETVHAMAAVYQSLYSEPDGGVRATFEFISMTAWKPDPTQPVAKDRGTADLSMDQLADVLDTPIETIQDN